MTGTVSASAFVLSHSLETCPEVLFEVERVVSSGDRSVMPLLWARGESRASISSALESDPTVANVSVVGDFEEELLFRMEWVDQVDLVVQMITNSEATILDAVGVGDRWKLRVLYPRRSLFSRTHEFCEEHGIPFEVESVRDLDAEHSGRFGLTTKQYEVLTVAKQLGYFEVPQVVTLEELADELDISHQATSERLKRATSALIEDTLFVGLAEEEFATGPS